MNGGFGSENTAVLRLQLRTNVIFTDTETVLPEESVKVFPNPTSYELNVDVVLEDAFNTTRTLAKIDRTVILLQTQPKIQNGRMTFDVSHLPAGVYFVKTTTEDATRIGRFVKF